MYVGYTCRTIAYHFLSLTPKQMETKQSFYTSAEPDLSYCTHSQI